MEGNDHAEGALRSAWGLRIREGSLDTGSASEEEILG